VENLRLLEDMARTRYQEYVAETDARRIYLLAKHGEAARSRGLLATVKHVLMVLGIRI